MLAGRNVDEVEAKRVHEFPYFHFRHRKAINVPQRRCL